MKVFPAKYYSLILIWMTLLLPVPWQGLNAQTIPNHYQAKSVDASLIPASDGKLMGYVDRKNKVIILPIFEAVSFFDENGLAQVKKNNLYGIIDKKGNTIVNFISSSLVTYHRAPNSEDERHGKVLSTRLYYVHNETTGQWQLFAPLNPNKASKVYTTGKPKFDDRLSHVCRSKNENRTLKFGYKKIETPDGKVNYIDTLFAEVFPTGFVNGMPLSKDIFVIHDETGKAGLFKKDGTKISDHHYYSISNSGIPEYFIAQGVSQQKGLIDHHGKLIIDTAYSDVRLLKNNHYLVIKNSQKGIITSTAQQILPVEYQEINMVNEKLYYVKKDNQYFTVDHTGKIVSGPYPQINQKYGINILTSFRNDSTLFINEAGKVHFKKPGNYTVQSVKNDLLVITKDQKRGILDLNGKIILSPEYDEILITDIENAVVVHKDKKAGIYSITKGWIVPISLDDYKIKYSPSVPTRPDNILDVYVPKGSMSYTNSISNISWDTIIAFSDQNSRIQRHGDSSTVLLANGKKFTYTDKDLKPVTNGDVLFFKKRVGNNTLILDGNLKPILPEGYIFHESYDYKGSYIFEIHTNARDRGLYHIDGKWIYGPIQKGVVEKLTDDVWYMGKEDQLQLFNNDFNPLSSKFYKTIKKAGNSYLQASNSDSKQLDIYNSEGKLVREVKYSEFISQINGFITWKKSADGDLLSCLTDTMLNEIRCFPYADVEPIENNNKYLIVKDLYDYGVISTTGEVMIPIKYSGIKYYPLIDVFQLRRGNHAYDIVSLTNGVKISNINASKSPSSLNDKYVIFHGDKNSYLFSVATKNYITTPSLYEGLFIEKELKDQDLLSFTKNNRTTYIDAKTGVVFKID